MTDQYARGRGVDIVPGLGEVSDDDTGTASDRWAVDENVVPSPPEPTSGNGSAGSTVDTVKEQSAQVGQQAADTGQHVASVAKDEAQAVVSEATDKARDLLGDAKTQLAEQASTQQNALASMLRSIADELHDMAEHSSSARSFSGADEPSPSSGNGLAGEAVREVSTRASGVASWLEQHEPSDALDEVTRFARRRPGLFLALAGAAGLLAGRFTRGLTGAGNDTSATSPDAGKQVNSRAKYPSADTGHASASTPGVLIDRYPESTPPGASAPEAISSGDAESAWGTSHD